MDFWKDLGNKYMKMVRFIKDSLNKVKGMDKVAIILQTAVCTADNGNKI